MTQTRSALVVAVGGGGADAAVAWAAARAIVDDRDLHLVHAVDGPAGVAGPESLRLSFEAAQAGAQQVLQRAQERARELTLGRVDVAVDCPVGEPALVLTDLARASAGIVLQHRHRSRLQQAVEGSVVHAVAARSDVPVVSVPEDWTVRTGGVVRPRVALGVDELDASDDLIGYAVDLATRLEADLTLLHAWDVSLAHELTLLTPEQPATMTVQAEEALREAAEPWRAKAPDLTIRTNASRGHPGEVLTAASHDCDLLVLGRGRAHTPGRHLGSVVRALLRAAQCPVEVVPLPRPHADGPAS